MDYQFEIQNIPEQRVLFIAEAVRQDGLGGAFMRLLPEVYGYAVSNGAESVGPPFGRYTDWRESDCDLEAGVIVGSDIAETTRIQKGSYGGFRAVVTQHMGPYDDLPKAHEACQAWILANSEQVSGAPCEIFITDPGDEPDSAKWRTDVVWPIL